MIQLFIHWYTNSRLLWWWGGLSKLENLEGLKRFFVKYLGQPLYKENKINDREIKSQVLNANIVSFLLCHFLEHLKISMEIKDWLINTIFLSRLTPTMSDWTLVQIPRQENHYLGDELYQLNSKWDKDVGGIGWVMFNANEIRDIIRAMTVHRYMKCMKIKCFMTHYKNGMQATLNLWSYKFRCLSKRTTSQVLNKGRGRKYYGLLVKEMINQTIEDLQDWWTWYSIK